MSASSFTAALWVWEARRADTWVFVTLPADVSRMVDEAADARGPRAAFGSVKVDVRIDGCRWRTSVFPDSESGCFVLPVKRSVREAVGAEPGDLVTVHLSPVP